MISANTVSKILNSDICGIVANFIPVYRGRLIDLFMKLYPSLKILRVDLQHFIIDSNDECISVYISKESHYYQLYLCTDKGFCELREERETYCKWKYKIKDNVYDEQYYIVKSYISDSDFDDMLNGYFITK